MNKILKAVRHFGVATFAALLAQGVWAALTTDFLYTGSGNGSTTGWFTGWDGEPFADARRAIGPSNMGLVFAADHVNTNVKWHPYKGYQVPATFSIALYTDLSAVSNPDTETAALFAAGRNSGDRAILYKHGNKVGLATNGGDVETDIPTEGGYHLYTVTYTSDKITIAIDNGTPVEKTGTFARPATGFQIAGIYGGVGIWNNPRGLPVAAVVGFGHVLTADEMTELTTTYPATAETTLTSELAYNQNGGIIYAGTITHNSKLSIKRGMLTIPAGADCKVKAIDFGDTQGSDGTFGLDLDGALTIIGVSSKSDANQGNNSVKNSYVNGEGGFLGGDWEGSGTYNIRGTLTIADSYMQPIHDAGMQTYNIEDGGKLIVKGIQAGTFHAKSTPQHVFNVKNGGLLQVKTALSLGTINANIEEGGTLELTDTFDHMLNNSNLGGVTCAGKLKLTGTRWVMLPTDATKAANLAAIAEIENNISGDNGQILLPAAQTFTIGSLSGTGGVRGDYTPNSARTLKIVQSKDTTWSGAVKDDSNAARIINFEVASANGSTLTMSGTYTGNNVRTGVLTVDEGGAVKLTKVWPTAGFNVNGTLTIEHGVWQPVYMVKGAGTINWAGTNTFSVNAADGDDALILDGTTINQTAGTLSLRAPGNRTDDSHQDNIGYIKDATITSSSTLSCSGKIGVKGACSITKTAGTCSISTIELSEADATLVLDGVTMAVTSGVDGKVVSYDEDAKTYSLIDPTVTITIPTVENMTAAVVDGNGQTIEMTGNTITVTIGSTFVVTYTPDEGFIGEAITLEAITAAADTTVAAPTEGLPVVAVAKVGTTYYTTLQDAVDEAEDGDTVTLIADTTESIYNEFADITLHINEGVTLTGETWFTLFNYRHTLTIEGEGTIKGAASDPDGYPIIALYNSGTMYVKGCTIESKDHVIYVNQAVKTEVSGGQFNKTPGNWLANGYTTTKSADGKYYVVEALGYIAKIGDKTYETLQAAVDEVKEGETIELVCATNEEVAFNKDFVVVIKNNTYNFGTFTGAKARYERWTAQYSNTANYVLFSKSMEALASFVAANDSKYTGSHGRFYIYEDWTLASDVRIPSRGGATQSVFPVKDTFVLDLNGHTLDQQPIKNGHGGYPTIVADYGKKVTIKDSSEAKTGVLCGWGWAVDIYDDAKTCVTLESGTITTHGGQHPTNADFHGRVIRIMGGAFIMNGGAITLDHLEAGHQIFGIITALTAEASKPAITINGGYVRCATAEQLWDPNNIKPNCLIGGSKREKSSVTVNGGTFTSEIPVEYIAEGLEVVKSANGNWVVRAEVKVDIQIKIDGGSTTPIAVAETWVEEKLGAGATTEQIKDALEAKEANGLKGWQNYAMGLDGSKESNTLKPIEGRATAAEKVGKTLLVVIEAPLNTVAPRAASSKITVKYNLYRGKMGTDGKIVWEATPAMSDMASPRFVMDVAEETGDTYWKIEAVFTPYAAVAD